MTQIPNTVPDVDDLTLSESDRRELIDWAKTCVERLLPIFTDSCPTDDRLEHALSAVDDFRAGTLTVGAMRKQAFSCHDAARECADPAASAVARACGQAIAIAHMGGHARNVARYTRKAMEGQALADELAWQRTCLPARFHDYVYLG